MHSHTYTHSCTYASMHLYTVHADRQEHTQTQMQQINPATCTDSFTFVFSDSVLNALYQYVADLLQW